jgi:uroporphyrinogen decarboxylase
MNNRQRIINTISGKHTDRAPFFFPLGLWEETAVRWESEGIKRGHWDDGLGFDRGFVSAANPDFPNRCVNLGLWPWFDYELISENERTSVQRDRFGGTSMFTKHSDSLPKQLTFSVTCMDDWNEIKKRLDPEDPARFPADFDEIAKELNEGDGLVVLGDYPYGLFGTCREFMGVEELLVSFYTQPELVHEMMDYLCDFWITMYEKIAAKVKIDCVHMWEDMSGKSGPLISPGFVREFMSPNYKKISAFCRRHNIEIFSVDTDGDVRDLIEPFIEAGVNLMYPFEIVPACTTMEYREKYPALGILGGIDKMEIAKGKEAIDALMPKIKELLDAGRYIPSPDHAIPPEVSYENYVYFVKRLRETIGECADLKEK